MILQKLVTQRSPNLIAASRLVALAPVRHYYKDDVLMPREQGEYYADPYAVAERVVRLVGLHENCKDPAAVALNCTFEQIGLNALDMCEVFIGLEREFDIEFADVDCEGMTTVNDIVEAVARNNYTK